MRKRSREAETTLNVTNASPCSPFLTFSRVFVCQAALKSIAVRSVCFSSTGVLGLTCVVF